MAGQGRARAFSLQPPVRGPLWRLRGILHPWRAGKRLLRVEVGPYSEDEVRQKFETEPLGQAQLIVGLLSPATLLDILRDYVVYEPERGRLVKKLPRYQLRWYPKTRQVAKRESSS